MSKNHASDTMLPKWVGEVVALGTSEVFSVLETKNDQEGMIQSD